MFCVFEKHTKLFLTWYNYPKSILRIWAQVLIYPQSLFKTLVFWDPWGISKVTLSTTLGRLEKGQTLTYLSPENLLSDLRRPRGKLLPEPPQTFRGDGLISGRDPLVLPLHTYKNVHPAPDLGHLIENAYRNTL